jgi:hypothetical protein
MRALCEGILATIGPCFAGVLYPREKQRQRHAAQFAINLCVYLQYRHCSERPRDAISMETGRGVHAQSYAAYDCLRHQPMTARSPETRPCFLCHIHFPPPLRSPRSPPLPLPLASMHRRRMQARPKTSEHPMQRGAVILESLQLFSVHQSQGLCEIS